jgi:hypothetical protein
MAGEPATTGSINGTVDPATDGTTAYGENGNSGQSPLVPDLSYSGMSERRTNTLMFLPIFSGTLSVIGSMLILVSLFRAKVQSTQRKNRPLRGRGRRGGRSQSDALSPVYSRLLAAMSIYDIIMTFFSAMIGVLLGTGTDTSRRREGTQFDCTLQGFLFQWGFGSFAYGAWLNVYYVLTIRYNVREQLLVKYFEPAAHICVFVFYFSTALIASLNELMNPVSVSTCWIAPYPIYCTEFDFIPCQRGPDYKAAILFMVMIPSCVCVSVILVSLGLVAHTVWQRHSASLKYQLSIEDSASCQQNSGVSSGRELPPRTLSDSSSLVYETTDTLVAPEVQSRSSSLDVVRKMAPKKSSQRSDRLAKQAILQCVVSGCTFAFTNAVWSTVGYGLVLTDNSARLISDLYWVSSRCAPALLIDVCRWNGIKLNLQFMGYLQVSVLAWLFGPVQGLFNFFIFIFPRYRNNRWEFSQMPRWWALYQAVWNPLGPDIQRIAHRSTCSNGVEAGGSAEMDQNIRFCQQEALENDGNDDKASESCKERTGNSCKTDEQTGSGTSDDNSNSRDTRGGQEMPLASPAQQSANPYSSETIVVFDWPKDVVPEADGSSESDVAGEHDIDCTHVAVRRSFIMF